MAIISLIRLAEDAAPAPQFWKGLGDPYKIHSMIWDLFSDGTPRSRNFLYRVDFEGGKPDIITVSKWAPEDETGIWKIETKLYAPFIRGGDRFVFRVRVNPIVTRRDESGKQRRHDVVMDAQKRLTQEGESGWTQQDLIQNEGGAWLDSRGPKNGFLLDAVRAREYRQLRFDKPGAPRPLAITTMDLEGILTVTEPKKFTPMLREGLGPAKGFGCWLMLIKPA